MANDTLTAMIRLNEGQKARMIELKYKSGESFNTQVVAALEAYLKSKGV